MKEEEFTSKLLSTIDAKFNEIMASKPNNPKEKFLNYVDAQTISANIRSIFVKKIGFIPNKIEATLNICEAVISPTLEEKKRKIKKAIGIVGGIGGLSLIIPSIVSALTAPVLLTIVAPVPIISIPLVLGFTIATLAGFLTFSGNDQLKNTEKYMQALKEGIAQSVHQTWNEFSDKIKD